MLDKPLCTAVAVFGVIGLCGTAPVAAQGRVAEVWNDARTLELVQAATQRRAVQLADTGLRDYTARATGYITFLAQMGDGFPAPPVLIKADQLEVEVYWGAPDQSKQRIIGRRDTLLMPTDQEYHRDHLGIIQNNFPETIRLGDGDEVLDVPHPLSALGQQTYDYRIADSLIIRSGSLALDVMMIRVRPKDDRAPAAIGAVYLDRQSASVVRMTFSFTRAALRDRRLEDVSVILENGLVDGRFWLPRRQEIEIRRSASWMDFPVRGIIRGRWEICCVQTNLTLAPHTFYGPEIVEVPRDEQRRFPFPGSILDSLPPELRALDAAEVRAVQEEARALVRASALNRTRSANVSSRGISDFVRSDRVEGLALGAGVSQRLGWGLTVSGNGRYGTADDEFKGIAQLAWRNARGQALILSRFDDFLQVGETAEVSGFRNSIAAQEFGSDWSDPIGVRGYALRFERTSATGTQVQLEYQRRTERALAVNASPTSGRFAPTIAAEALDRHSLAAGWSHTGRVGSGDGRVRTTARVSYSSLGPPVDTTATLTPLNEGLFRASADVEFTLPTSRGILRTRTIIAGVGHTDLWGTPAQDAIYFGGPATGPGYEFHSLVASRALSQRIEWQARIPFVPLNLGRFGNVPSSLVVAPYVHAVWLGRPLRGGLGWHPAVGLGTIAFFDLLRLDVSRGLSNGRWLFSVDVTREFWPVM